MEANYSQSVHQSECFSEFVCINGLMMMRCQSGDWSVKSEWFQQLGRHPHKEGYSKITLMYV